jgi:Pilus formation protein N terminal region
MRRLPRRSSQFHQRSIAERKSWSRTAMRREIGRTPSRRKPAPYTKTPTRIAAYRACPRFYRPPSKPRQLAASRPKLVAAIFLSCNNFRVCADTPRQSRSQKISQGRNWPRLQVSIATILWLTLCVACFFGGRYWDRIAKATSGVLTKPPVAALAPNALRVQISQGQSTVIDAGVAVNRMMAADPTVVRIVPISDRSIQLSGNRVGNTQITVWEASTGLTATYDVSVK